MNPDALGRLVQVPAPRVCPRSVCPGTQAVCARTAIPTAITTLPNP